MLSIFTAALMACGGGVATSDAAPPDGTVNVTPDAGPDAAMPAPPPDVSELVTGGGRLSGGAYQTDVQLGHWFSQQPFSGGNAAGQGAAAIKP